MKMKMRMRMGVTVIKNPFRPFARWPKGTSFPEALSMVTHHDYADHILVNVSGTNAVSVFLGVGLAWFLAATFHASRGTSCGFYVEAEALGAASKLFTGLSVVAFVIILMRQLMLGGALGGKQPWKKLTALLFFFFYFLYVLMEFW